MLLLQMRCRIPAPNDVVLRCAFSKIVYIEFYQCHNYRTENITQNYCRSLLILRNICNFTFYQQTVADNHSSCEIIKTFPHNYIFNGKHSTDNYHSCQRKEGGNFISLRTKITILSDRKVSKNLNELTFRSALNHAITLNFVLYI